MRDIFTTGGRDRARGLDAVRAFQSGHVKLVFPHSDGALDYVKTSNKSVSFALNSKMCIVFKINLHVFSFMIL